MRLGAVMSWISGDHNSFGAEQAWASCTLFGNQTVESPALRWSGAVPLTRSPGNLAGGA